jgi:prepilin-type N-terminal cleavage/methylation domain-containing protein
MKRRSRGFTLIELIIAIMIGAILTSLAVKGFGTASTNLAARQARNVFNGMAARARAQAIESGSRTMLVANMAGDSVMIFAQGGVVENVRFGRELDVDLSSSVGNFNICMSPRGYADTDCSSSSTTIKLSFTAGANTESLEILPLGQIRW